MGNTFSRRRRNRDYQQQPPPSGVPTSVSTSQTHEDDGSTQSHTRQSEITVSENKESRIILTYQDKLINAVFPNTLSIAGVLLEYELIPDEVPSKILRPSSTPQEKATILVSAIMEKIKTDPKKFPELIRVFSEQVSTKDIAAILQSAYQDESKFSYSYMYSISKLYSRPHYTTASLASSPLISFRKSHIYTNSHI